VEKRGYGALFAIKRTSVSLFFGESFTGPKLGCASGVSRRS